LTKFSVIDLFAGPGGLGEGFTGYTTNKGERPYSIAFSVEKDTAAHSTLRLRSFLRQFKRKFPKEYYRAINSGENLPDFSILYPAEWEAAENEALHLELGILILLFH
jgi:DNA (cytosine-5)-methyltransferase 1